VPAKCVGCNSHDWDIPYKHGKEEEDSEVESTVLIQPVEEKTVEKLQPKEKVAKQPSNAEINASFVEFPCVDGHVHSWDIDTPKGTYSKGFCRNCKKTKWFSNYDDRTSLEMKKAWDGTLRI